MKRGLSLYLDLLRLLAALEVFAYHLAGFPALGIERAWWNAFGHEAVTIFFVLSGFVIRHAAEYSDRTIDRFAVSRLTRVYSVAMPCLLLTLLFDAVGQQIAPDLYAGLVPDGSRLLRLAFGATMLNEAWVSVQMLSNTPYWSMSYEFWYYGLFATSFYLRGRQRLIAGLACAAIAGPKILLLFPIWLLGWAAYRETLSRRAPQWLGWALFAQPLALLAFYDHFQFARTGQTILESLIGYQAWRQDLSWSRYVLSDTLLGVGVALHLVGAKIVADRLETALRAVARPIRFCAGRSFTLYLLHQPALLFTAACLTVLTPSRWHGAVIAGVTLAIVFAVAAVTEEQRHRLKPLFAAAIRHLTSLRRQIRPPSLAPIPMDH